MPAPTPMRALGGRFLKALELRTCMYGYVYIYIGITCGCEGVGGRGKRDRGRIVNGGMLYMFMGLIMGKVRRGWEKVRTLAW